MKACAQGIARLRNITSAYRKWALLSFLDDDKMSGTLVPSQGETRMSLRLHAAEERCNLHE
jgi:hypothetical protein